MNNDEKAALTVEERFWPKVRKTEGCWLWIGAHQVATKTALPYGTLWKRVGKTWLKAHRVSWELAHGEIPDRMWVLHRCDNPLCVNPAHLFLGTPAANNSDCRAKMRHRFGVRHWKAKLTEDDVRSMRRSYAEGISTTEIGRRFGINQAAAWQVVNRRLWAHIA